MAIPVFTVGEVLTASLVNSWLAPLAAYKSADQSVTSSTVLVNDTALVLAVAANSTYFFTAFLDYEGGTQGSSDFKMAWSVPASATMRWTRIGLDTAGAVNAGALSDQTSTPAMGTNGAGNVRGVTLHGTLNVSSTSGNFQFQWAQNTSSGTATIVHAGSYLQAQRIA